MGKLGFKIDTSELNRIVKVQCTANDCRNNTRNRSYGEDAFHCALKYIGINSNGCCNEYEPISKKED